jgi:hypothetical protein
VNIDVECIPCFIRQAVETSARAGADASLLWRIMRDVAGLIETLSPDECPPQFAERVYDAISAAVRNGDVFAAEKSHANALALELEPGFRRTIDAAPDPLLAAVKLAIAGNSMDLGVIFEYGDVGALAESVLSAELGIDNYAALRSALATASSVLVVGDNCGEAVFDRMLIEQMRRVRDCRYAYVVRGRPIINDVTAQDAVSAGIDRVATLLDTGSGAPGLVLSACSAETRKQFFAADLVIAKGQGNYEAISEAPRDVFFLLMVKCPVVSRHLHAPVGVAVTKHHLAP